jgi:class 3 adenylate cyclase
VHSGVVVSGCLGSGARLEFTVVGDTVNIASRLEALTKEKGVSVLVSATTAEQAARHLGALGADLSLSPLGEVHLRGRSEPLAILALGAADAGETMGKESAR